MRVLQVTHQFLPEYVGGVEVHVAQLSRSLRDAGHQVALFTGGNHAEQRTWEGMELTTVAGGVRSRAAAPPRSWPPSETVLRTTRLRNS